MSLTNQTVVAGALLGLAVLTGISFWKLVSAKDPLSFEGHWGGFGGGLGGWTISHSLAYLITAVFFGTLLTILGGYALHHPAEKPAGGDTKQSAPAGGVSLNTTVVHSPCDPAEAVPVTLPAAATAAPAVSGSNNSAPTDASRKSAPPASGSSGIPAPVTGTRAPARSTPCAESLPR